MNTESQTDRINQLEIERDEAKVATDFANLRIEQLEAALSEEKRIVDRVWNALGISTYEQAKPLAIDEHVKSLLDRLQKAEAKAVLYDEAEKALDGRLGIDDKAVVWACEEYVSAEDELPDCFDTEDYRLSKAVKSLAGAADRLQAVEAESKSRRKEIAALDEQLIEAKRAIETQYNLRQAVEAERDRCKRLLESFKAFVSVTPVNPLNTWLEERDKLISNSECRVCSTCGGLLGSHYAGTPCSCIQALQPAQKEQK